MKSPASRCSGIGSAIAASTAAGPIIGDRRPPSPLDKIQPDHWLPEYTTDLLDLLNVLGRLIALEPGRPTCWTASARAGCATPRNFARRVRLPTPGREAGIGEGQEEKQNLTAAVEATGKMPRRSRGRRRSPMIYPIRNPNA